MSHHVSEFSTSTNIEDSAELVNQGMQNQGQNISDFNLIRSSSQGNCSPQHKIAVFSRNPLVVTGFKTVQDLDVYAFCDLDECLSTARIFPQDDCLHTELPPVQSLVDRPSRCGRARYNFQQGLLNTKEVLELKASWS